jgi:DNA-directed RNA polymerase subunit RPC12/RpoP
MEKEVGNLCPRCGLKNLNVYYEEGADVELGASCNGCGLKGFFMNGRLIQLATM